MIGDHATGLEEELAKLAEELSGCYEELALLHGLMDRLRPFTDAQRVVRTVLEMVAEALRVRYAFVLLLDNDGTAWRSSRLLWVESSDGARRGFVHGRRLRVHAYDGITRHALETGRPLIVNDVTADARFCPYPMPIASMLTVPLKGHDPGGDHTLGALNAANRLDGQDFTSGDLKLLATVAGLAGAALENALLVSSLKRANRELQEANRTIVNQQAAMLQAEKLSSLGRMAAGIAHELRNPLTVILGRVQLALMRAASDQEHDVADVSRTLGYVEQQALRADRIIRSLSTFAREGTTEMGPVDLGTVVTAVLELVRPQVKMDRIEVRTELDPDLPSIRANHDQLLQVFINLIVNASQAMPEGGTVSIAVRAAHPGMVRAIVADTGCGIPPENLARIFDPFFTTKPRGEGTGLGLSIIHGIVESHGGTINVASKPREGTTFTLDFPVPAGSCGSARA